MTALSELFLQYRTEGTTPRITGIVTAYKDLWNFYIGVGYSWWSMIIAGDGLIRWL